MTTLRFLLVLLLVVFGAYTVVVVASHGVGFLQVFFGDLAAMGWPGQINLDFLIYVALSGLWIAWRHDFTAAGIALGLLALFGAVMLLPYLLWATANARGDIAVLLLGRRRASGTPG